jgi:NADH-quinone oxidoreductase subunit E
MSRKPDMPFSLPAKLEAEINELIARYPVKRSAALMVLHALQDHFGFISPEAMEWTAGKVEVQPISIYELVTFYPMLHQEKVGKFHLRVCRTLSCMLGGSYQLHEHLCGKLGLDPRRHGPQTTPDGRFTVEFVECLASCGTAPVVMCNESLHENVTPQRAEAILAECGEA